jgi:hypothetical protein
VKPAKKFNEIMGTRLIGFDPGYTFSYGESSFTLPYEIVKKITNIFEVKL